MERVQWNHTELERIRNACQMDTERTREQKLNEYVMHSIQCSLLG